jgi:ERCC4-related helicase
MNVCFKGVSLLLSTSATPGNDLPAVKAVLQNLFISHIGESQQAATKFGHFVNSGFLF